MERTPPRTTSDEIDLYIRTYYSLLRSSGDVKVRAFEEAHIYSQSSLHTGARSVTPDAAAFAYAAARLPACILRVRRVVLGQSYENFEAAGMEIRSWQRVRTRGRRRPLRWDGGAELAIFIASSSDIDDLVPILTAYQIEWNKMHERLAGSRVPLDELGAFFGLEPHEAGMLRSALAESGDPATTLAAVAAAPVDLVVRLLNGSFSQYQVAAQRWWGGIEPAYVQAERPRRRPVYFMSSNLHCLGNLLGGYAHGHRDELFAFGRDRDLEGLRDFIGEAVKRNDEVELANLSSYLLGAYLRHGDRERARRVELVQRHDAESGLVTIETPGKVDVGAQVVDLARLNPERLDPRVRVPGLEALAASKAMLINIDYPLGMAAYHHLSRLAQGVGEIRGIYVMGKAATLNGRVGDVMISTVTHDEHSANTYLFRNCFAAGDVQPLVRHGTVFDSQKALTVRSAFLQNRDYMGVFYREGYTVLEMESGPFLSAIYEIVNPNRHPKDEIVHLSNQTPFDVGFLHYASDTPYSRRQSLLSKSLSYFGVDATYGCAAAIVRRILTREVAILDGGAA